MAQIDPNIALGFRMPQIQDPLAATARAQEIGVNALKMNEYQRGIEQENKLRELIASGADLNSPETMRQMYSISPKMGTEFEKSRATIQKEKFGAQKMESEAVDSRLKLSRQLLDGISTPEQYVAWHEANHRDPVLGPLLAARGITADQSRQKIATALSQPGGLQKLINESKLGVEEFTKLNTISAAQQQTADIQKGQLDLSRQNQQLQYGPDVVANTVTDAAGNVTQFNRFGQVIGKPGAVGKPSATFEKTAALQKQTGRDLDLAIKELTEATKDKGLIDQSTGSGAGRLVDVAAGFAGQATPGAIAIAKLKPIADMALKMVPRFEGPQSDKDTASYKEAAGQLADPSLPTQIRKEAGKEVLRLMKARKGQFVNEAMANEGIGAGGVDTSNPLLK